MGSAARYSVEFTAGTLNRLRHETLAILVDLSIGTAGLVEFGDIPL